MRLFATLLLSALAFPLVAAAQPSVDVSPQLGFGFARVSDVADGQAMGVLNGGATLRASRFHVPLDVSAGIRGGEPSEGFYYDESVDRCRNESNGEFAPDSECESVDASVWASGSLAFDVYISDSYDVYVGAGADVGAFTSPHGTVGVALDAFQGADLVFEGRAWSDQFTILASVAF